MKLTIVKKTGSVPATSVEPLLAESSSSPAKVQLLHPLHWSRIAVGYVVSGSNVGFSICLALANGRLAHRRRTATEHQAAIHFGLVSGISFT